MRVLSIFAIAFAMTTTAFAGVKTVTGESERGRIDISSVQQQITLVQSQKGESNLRVSFLVSDNGGSTDVSPSAELYLTMFNESEMTHADSVHRIASMNSLLSHRRISAGIYEAVVTMYDYDRVCSGNSYEVVMTHVIDARDLSVRVRNFGYIDQSDFGYARVTSPLTVTSTASCR